ncbi:MAG TPA: efflux RND transporter periplasmic adaptor subunit [Rubrivivax sp.]|nr:efflux RND transporter periplasmic adaptor subunit [Rubrivivax sp.]HRY89250.1 efflux RND transporter periplasmic adaptor subunit [Rubrivivax sp.]HRZ61590.1 efflux RND transporter periplasmic adaptor subunit [Rubrivivax sp.]
MNVAAAAVALMLAWHAGNALAEDKPAAQEPPVAQVRTAKPVRAVIGARAVAYGTVTLAQDAQINLSLPYAAQITRLRAGVGQTVRRDDVLFAATADPSAVLAAQQAQSALTLARGELERTRALLDQRLATRSQLATAQKGVADAEQALAAQSTLGAEPGERAVRAPYDGVVLKVAAAQGDRVAPGTVVLQLGRTGAAVPTRVTLGLEPALWRAVPVGAAVEVTTLAAPAGAGATRLAGRVSRVQAAINPQSRLVDTSVELAAHDGARLIPGEPVQGVIALPGAEHWVVPRLAVLRDDQGAYVYQVDQRRARRVAVQVRVDNGEHLGVDGALQAGLPLVVQGNYQLTDGMAVREGGR